MEPTPETAEALNEFAQYGDTALLLIFRRMTVEVQRIVPECVGLSLTLMTDRLTFTAVASDPLIARLDATQYLDDGPCVESVRTGAITAFDPTDESQEERWRLFATATAATGIASTLSLPILDGQRVVAGVNLYASTADAFDGRHEAVAHACDASAAGAVKNADLTFSTRHASDTAAGRIRDEIAISRAVGMLVAADYLTATDAAARLAEAARRAGISQAVAAEFVMAILRPER